MILLIFLFPRSFCIEVYINWLKNLVELLPFMVFCICVIIEVLTYAYALIFQAPDMVLV